MAVDISFNPVSMITSAYNSDRQDTLNRQSMHQSQEWNRMQHQLDLRKQRFAEQQYRDAKYDNQYEKLVNDANKAGISITTALGSAGATPPSVGIPGQTTKRVSGNKHNNITADVQMKVINDAQAKLLQAQGVNAYHQASLNMWRAANEKKKNQGIGQNELPKKYDLYQDNTEEAKAHIRNGGFAVPSGASMELPESIGAYHFGKPYITEEDFTLQPNYNNVDTGIAP